MKIVNDLQPQKENTSVVQHVPYGATFRLVKDQASQLKPFRVAADRMTFVVVDNWALKLHTEKTVMIIDLSKGLLFEAPYGLKVVKLNSTLNIHNEV